MDNYDFAPLNSRAKLSPLEDESDVDGMTINPVGRLAAGRTVDSSHLESEIEMPAQKRFNDSDRRSGYGRRYGDGVDGFIVSYRYFAFAEEHVGVIESEYCYVAQAIGEMTSPDKHCVTLTTFCWWQERSKKSPSRKQPILR